MNQVIKGLKEGPWEYYCYDGRLAYRGTFLHDQMVGYWVSNRFITLTYRKKQTEFYL